MVEDGVGVEEYSFSRLTTFNTCKLAFFKRYIEDNEGKENAFSQFGTLVHSILERYAKGELDLWDLFGTYKNEFVKAIPEDFPPLPHYHKVYRNDMRRLYFDQGLEFFRNFAGYDDRSILGVEKEFVVPVNDWNLRGTIDLMYVDSDGRMVIEDYKSKSGFKTIAEQKKYARQLYLYSLYFKKTLGRYPDVLRFLLIRKNKSVEIPFSEDSLQEAVAWANDTVAEIRQCLGYNPSTDEFFCNHLCNFRCNCTYIPKEERGTKSSKEKQKE